MNNQVIPDEAVDAAVEALLASKLGDHAGINGEEFVEAAHLALEAAAPHMLADEAKLAAVIVALDPLERVTKWMVTDDEAGRYALEAVQKIRAILDGAQ